MKADRVSKPDSRQTLTARLPGMHLGELGSDATSRAVIRGAFEVMASLQKLGSGRVSEVHRDCGLPRTTVQRLLVQLEEVGAVERSSRRWRLGATVVELGAGVPAEPRLRRVARRPLVDLANATGCLVALSVEMSGRAVVVEVVPGKARLALEPEPGMVLDESKLAAIRAQAQAHRGDLRPVIDAGGVDPRISCVAAPMRLSAHDVAAVWLMVPSGGGVPESYVLATRRVAGRIASNLTSHRF